MINKHMMTESKEENVNASGQIGKKNEMKNQNN